MTGWPELLEAAIGAKPRAYARPGSGLFLTDDWWALHDEAERLWDKQDREAARLGLGRALVNSAGRRQIC